MYNLNIKNKVRKIMSFFKLAFAIVAIFSSCLASKAPKPEEVVQNLYNALHTASDVDQTQSNPENVFSPILDKYLDWNQIMNSILVEPRIAMNRAKSAESKNKFKSTLTSFLEDFIDIFKSAIIKKYSTGDYLNKFKQVKEFTINNRQIKVSENKAEIPSSAKIVENGNTTQWNLTWKLHRTGDDWKVADLAIEGGIQLFKTEQDAASSKYRAVTQGKNESEDAFKKGLKAVGEMYNFDYYKNTVE